MKLLTSARPFALALLAGTVSAAQSPHLWIVDAALEPGAHFASVAAAVAAAEDGDVLLVRAGTYRENVVIAGKGLTLVGAPGAARPMLHGLQVLRTPQGSLVSVRGLDMGLDDSPLEIRECAGKVWLEDVGVRSDFTNGIPPQHWIEDSAAVVLAACRFEAPEVTSQPTLTVRRSTVQAFGSSLVGGDARDLLFSHGEMGAPALWVDDGRVLLSGCTLRGGAGSDILAPFCLLRGGPGGVALQVTGASRVELQDNALLGGPGGTSCGDDGPVGESIQAAGFTVHGLAGPYRACRLEPTGALGRDTVAVLEGPPGELALLLVSPSAAVGSSSPLFRGRLLLGDPLQIPLSARVPPSGELRLLLRLPRGLGTVGRLLHAQGLFVEPAGLALSGPSTQLVLGAHQLAAPPP